MQEKSFSVLPGKRSNSLPEHQRLSEEQQMGMFQFSTWPKGTAAMTVWFTVHRAHKSHLTYMVVAFFFIKTLFCF